MPFYFEHETILPFTPDSRVLFIVTVNGVMINIQHQLSFLA